MIEIRSGRLEPEAGTGPKTMTDTFYFDREIRNCWVALTGYKLGYSSGDHHLLTIGVDLSAAVRDTEFGRGVVVEATLLLRDKNGDDQFAGWADYLLFVELGRVRVVGESTGREPIVHG
jgi:hypothetical protein